METGSLSRYLSGIRHIPFWSLLLALSVPGGAQADDSLRAREVKAAFVLNIARFVYWTDDLFADHPAELRLCLYRDNPLGDALESIRHKKVDGRNLTTRQIPRLAAARGCNILFVPADQLENYRRDPAPTAPQPMLTITDVTHGSPDNPGTHIILVRRGTRIGFDIDLNQVKQSGPRLSSELLKLGRIIGATP